MPTDDEAAADASGSADQRSARPARPPTARGLVDVIDHPHADRRAEPAATVLLVRDTEGAAGLEVLMIRRSHVGSFGGMWAFPGGVVEASDVPPGTAPDPVPAARTAAVRETQEEVGLDVDPGSLVWWSHWLPDTVSPNRRFSTWFFLAHATDDHGSHAVEIDGAEVHEHRWVTPQEVLEHHRDGALQLAPPTFVTLLQLSSYVSVEAAFAQPPAENFATQLVLGDRGMRCCLWHGDVAYRLGGASPDRSDLDLDAPGPRHRLDVSGDQWQYLRSL